MAIDLWLSGRATVRSSAPLPATEVGSAESVAASDTTPPVEETAPSQTEAGASSPDLLDDQ